MLASMLNMFRVADLRKRILFTLLMIVLYRVGAFIPAPGIDVEQVQLLRDRANQGGVLAFLQLFSGGSLTTFAVFLPTPGNAVSSFIEEGTTPS